MSGDVNAATTPDRTTALVVIDNHTGCFCSLIEKISHISSPRVDLDVVFREAGADYLACLDVMGAYGGDAPERRARDGVDHLIRKIAEKGLSGTITVRSFGHVTSSDIYNGTLQLSGYDVVLYDNQAMSAFQYSGELVRFLAARANGPVIEVRRCDHQRTGRGGLAPGMTPTLMVIWSTQSSDAALLAFLSGRMRGYSRVVVWVDDVADGHDLEALTQGLQAIDPMIGVEVHGRHSWLSNRALKVLIDVRHVGAVILPRRKKGGPGRLMKAFRALRLYFLLGRRDFSRIHI